MKFTRAPALHLHGTLTAALPTVGTTINVHDCGN